MRSRTVPKTFNHQAGTARAPWCKVGPPRKIVRTLGDAAYILIKDWPSDGTPNGSGLRCAIEPSRDCRRLEAMTSSRCFAPFGASSKSGFHRGMLRSHLETIKPAPVCFPLFRRRRPRRAPLFRRASCSSCATPPHRAFRSRRIYSEPARFRMSSSSFACRALPSRFCEFWRTKTIRNVMIVVLVLITSCQVSE